MSTAFGVGYNSLGKAPACLIDHPSSFSQLSGWASSRAEKSRIPSASERGKGWCLWPVLQCLWHSLATKEREKLRDRQHSTPVHRGSPDVNLLSVTGYLMLRNLELQTPPHSGARTESDPHGKYPPPQGGAIYLRNLPLRWGYLSI